MVSTKTGVPHLGVRGLGYKVEDKSLNPSSKPYSTTRVTMQDAAIRGPPTPATNTSLPEASPVNVDLRIAHRAVSNKQCY